MVTTTSYGTWVNHGDDSNATVEASIADAINGGDRDWRERMESSGAMDDIARDWREAINEALPEGVTLAGNDFYGPAYDADASWEGELKIAEIIKGIDLGAIIARHDVDIPAEERPQPVIVSVVRGESPTARAVEPGPVVTIPDEWTTWAEGHGLGPDDTEVYLLVTPEDEAGEVAGEIAFRKFWLPAEDVAAIRAALDPAEDVETTTDADDGHRTLMEAGHDQLGHLAASFGARVDSHTAALTAARTLREAGYQEQADAIAGTVIPAGHSLGVPAKHADDDNARDAAAALIAAGHTPALLSGQYGEEDGSEDVDSAHGTGFMVDLRSGGRVYVYHLENGRDGGAISTHRDTLRGYRSTLRAAGWECDSRIFRCVQAWRTSPLPEGVTLAQTRGDAVPAPVPVVEAARAVLRGFGYQDAAQDGTGFEVTSDGSGCVYVSHLRAGRLVTRDEESGSDEELNAYAAALEAAGYKGVAIGAESVGATPEPEPVGPFDVRVFSSDREFAPRRGVVCIIVAQTWAEAWEIRDRESARPRRSAGIFYADTNVRLTASRPAAPSA